MLCGSADITRTLGFHLHLLTTGAGASAPHASDLPGSRSDRFRIHRVRIRFLSDPEFLSSDLKFRIRTSDPAPQADPDPDPKLQVRIRNFKKT